MCKINTVIKTLYYKQILLQNTCNNTDLTLTLNKRSTNMEDSSTFTQYNR